MRYNKNFKRILCAILCLCMTFGTLLTLTSCNSGSGEPIETTDPNANKVSVVRAIKTIEAGEKIKRADFEEVMIDKNLVPEGAYSTISEVVNKFLLVGVCSGDYLFEGKISKTAPYGEWGEEIHEDYVIVTEYIKTGEKDMARCIQKAIDENPNKTIYFPDGMYLIARPLKTSADPAKAVSFRFSNYAHLSVYESEWEGGDAIIEVGANDSSKGASCSVIGGILGAGNITAAIAVKGGHAFINNFSIKQATTGIVIKKGAVADVDSGVVIGAGSKSKTYEGAIGVLMEGDGSTLTNMRLCDIDVGVKVTGTRNVLRNIHPLYVGTMHDNSIGFWDAGTDNFFDVCYSDQFAVAFRIGANTKSIFNGCFGFWYTNNSRQYGFVADGQFNSIIRDTQINLAYGSNTADNPDGKADVDATFISIAQAGGNGVILYPRIAKPQNDDHKNAYSAYVMTEILN